VRCIVTRSISAKDDESYCRCVLWRRHGVRQTADRICRPDANGQIKDFFGERFDAGQEGAAARKNDFAENQIARHVFNDFLPSHP
jgi:hypothetical protein